MLKTKNYEKLHPCERRTGAGNIFSIMKTIKIIAFHNIQLLLAKTNSFVIVHSFKIILDLDSERGVGIFLDLEKQALQTFQNFRKEI